MRKEMMELRNSYEDRMSAILDLAKAEDRAMTEEEIAEFDNCENEIKNIDLKIEDERKVENMENFEKVVEMTQEEKDVKAFANYIRTAIVNDDPTDANMTKSDNGAVIPTTIAAKIIEKVAEISPLYAAATKYNAKGSLVIPYENTGDGAITVAYQSEFSDVLSTTNKFGGITLTGYLYGALTKISKSLINNADIDVVNWVVNKMAKSIAAFVEGELLNGTDSKTAGIVGSYDSANMKVTLASNSAPTGDELISLQDKVIGAYQSNCAWIMAPATLTAVRKLKDGEGRYLFDTASGTLLGRPVWTSSNVEGLGSASKNVIFYGDFSGLAVKESEALEVQVLLERYAPQHAVGVVAWGELDAKVEDVQKIALAVTPS